MRANLEILCPIIISVAYAGFAIVGVITTMNALFRDL
jgi:hypothetical protein